MHYLITVLISIFFAFTGNAQGFPSKAEMEKEILGTWYLKEDPEMKLKFYKNGKLERYQEDLFYSISTYEIAKTCKGETLKQGGFFLKEISGNGVISCSYIEGINCSGNGFFSIMTQNKGKIIVFEREVN